MIPLDNKGTIAGIAIKNSKRYCEMNPDNLIEILADEYVNLIIGLNKKKIQIIGYCISGLIAVEIARRLMERGLEIFDLVLIDSHPIQYQLEDELLMEITFLPSLGIEISQLGLGEISNEELYKAVLYLYNEFKKEIPGQYGTHVDVPGHADVNGRTLEKIDIKECVLPLCVINCSDKVKMNSDYALSLDDIHDYEKIYGKIPKGAFVAMRSDWGKRWPSQEKFQNMDEYGEQHYPGWSLEAVKYLIEKRDVTAIGHETFDTDPPFCKEQRYFQAECYVLKQDRYQIEMLTNLDKIPERGAIIFCIFVKQTNGTGFPVRCFAICPNK